MTVTGVWEEETTDGEFKECLSEEVTGTERSQGRQVVGGITHSSLFISGIHTFKSIRIFLSAADIHENKSAFFQSNASDGILHSDLKASIEGEREREPK